jgi:O-antigen ligase
MTLALSASSFAARRYCRFTLALTIASTPLYVLRYRIGPLPTTLLETLILITIALYVVAVVQSGSWRLRRTPIEIPTALLMIAAVIAIAVSVDVVGALGQFRAYFLEPVIIFYIAVDLLESERDFRLVMGALIAGATVFAILNLGVWAEMLARHQRIITTDAPEAFDQNPNAAAMFLEPAVALAGGLALYSSSAKDRRWAIAALGFLLASMVLTLSRAGLLTLAVLALVTVITMPQTRAKLVLLGSALVAAVVISRVPWVSQRLANQFDPTYPDSTFEGRLRIWSDSLHMLRDHLTFGAGLRAYTQVVTPYVTGRFNPQLHPHDVWLAMWSELGLLGMLAFATLMAILLWKGWRGFARTSGFHRAVLWGTSAAFITVLVHGIFDTPYFKNDLSLEFWAVAALEVAALGLVTRSAREATGEPAIRR